MDQTKKLMDFSLSKKQQRLNHKERLKLLKGTIDEYKTQYFFGEEDRIYIRKKDTREDICLGKVLVGERNLIYYKFEDERNIYLKTQAWSINYSIFKQIDLIHYETLKYNYTIPRVRAEEFGEILDYQNEKKIYIPIIYWDKRRNLIDPTELRRRNLFGNSWYELLKDVINSEYMSKIGNYLRQRRTETIVYPDEVNVFRALKLTHVKQVKVIILGQDPYHDGSANGLAFGFNKWKRDKDNQENIIRKTPKSLDIIFKEVERDIYNGFCLEQDYSLESWAEQGVLLLNIILTVERGKPKSHENLGWQRFVKIILYEMLKDSSPKVFLLWGNDAQNLFQEVVDKLPLKKLVGEASWHQVLKSKHPASDLYNADSMGNIEPNYPNTFAGNKHFSQCNQFLVKNKRKLIIW